MYHEKKFELQSRLNILRDIVIDDKTVIHMKDPFSGDFYIVKILDKNRELVEVLSFGSYFLFTNLNHLSNEKFHCQYGVKKVASKNYAVFLSSDKESTLNFAKFLNLILDKEINDIKSTLKTYERIEEILKI